MRRRAFTLIELLVVIAIIAVLMRLLADLHHNLMRPDDVVPVGLASCRP
jgi:prepilin-type N-terminal cleavage/methylation domain-containing protein